MHTITTKEGSYNEETLDDKKVVISSIRKPCTYTTATITGESWVLIYDGTTLEFAGRCTGEASTRHTLEVFDTEAELNTRKAELGF